MTRPGRIPGTARVRLRAAAAAAARVDSEAAGRLDSEPRPAVLRLQLVRAGRRPGVPGFTGWPGPGIGGRWAGRSRSESLGTVSPSRPGGVRLPLELESSLAVGLPQAGRPVCHQPPESPSPSH